MQTKTDLSYGVIPIRRVGESWEVFLIHQFSHIGKNSYWIFPKGHPKGNETPVESALRELKEETDMTAERLLAEPTFKLQYSFTFDGVQIAKTVIFFIGVIADQEFKIDDTEVKEGGWYSLETATERLDYQDTKQMFSEAKQFILQYKP